MIYRAIGRAVVRYVVLSVRRRYARPIRIGALAVAAALALGIAAYLAGRDVPEG